MDIASRIGKGAVVFEKDKRPSFLIDGRQAFVGAVRFSSDKGELTYTLEDAKGREHSSAYGERMLSALSPARLVSIRDAVTKAVQAKTERQVLTSKIENRVRKQVRQSI